MKQQPGSILTACLRLTWERVLLNLGLESTAPSAVPTRRRITGQLPWICVERAQPHNTRHASLVSMQKLILPLIRILCYGTNHHGGGRSPPRNLGTRESRGFKAECHLFPVFSSSQVGQGPSVAPQSCLVSNDNRKRVTGRDIICTCTTHRPRSCLASVMSPKPLQRCRMSPRGHGGTRPCWSAVHVHVHDHECVLDRPSLKGADPRAATPMGEQPQQPRSVAVAAPHAEQAILADHGPSIRACPCPVPTTFDLLHPCLQEDTPRRQPCLHR